MTRLDAAIDRLDAAMSRLDHAVAESAMRGGKDESLLQNELTLLRQTHAILQSEARLVAERLDDVIGRLNDVALEAVE